MRGFGKCALVLSGLLWMTNMQAHAAAGYDDVAVIVNTNSQASQTIGDYFKAKRSIPASNIIYVNVSQSEEIDDAEFQSLRSQVESHLQANNLVNSINYLVTTKGVPLKVNRGDTFSTSSPSASVESELSLILGSNASSIGGSGRIYSPYYSRAASFTHAAYGIYLVTRLDGYSVQDVLNLIDRSGPDTRVSKSSRFVLDQDPSWNAIASYLNDYLAQASSQLASEGKNVELNADSIYVTMREEVVGYVSWGSNDRHASEFTENAIPYNTWAPGALSETYVSTSGRSFEDPPSYGQSLIADLVREGVSGAKGYVYEPYTTSMANSAMLFDRYLDGYNLAESYYMASRYVSWMDVVVGDPKTTITMVDGQLPVQLASLQGMFNTSNAQIELTWTTLSELNNYGFFVQMKNNETGTFEDVPGSFLAGHGTTLQQQGYVFGWVCSDGLSGSLYVRLRQVDLDGTEHFSEAVMVEIPAHATSVTGEEFPYQFSLDQNFPNPFNPSTTIRYTVPAAGMVRLTVYNEIGQEIGVLVNAYQEAGTHVALFTTERTGVTASGVYYYRLHAGQSTGTRKMVYVK